MGVQIPPAPRKIKIREALNLRSKFLLMSETLAGFDSVKTRRVLLINLLQKG